MEAALSPLHISTVSQVSSAIQSKPSSKFTLNFLCLFSLSSWTIVYSALDLKERKGKEMACFSCCGGAEEAEQRTASIAEKTNDGGTHGDGTNGDGTTNGHATSGHGAIVHATSSHGAHGLGTKSRAKSSKSGKSGKSFRSFMNILSSKTGSSRQKIAEEIQKIGKAKVSTRIFTYQELVVATDNFNPNCLLGEGGFGRVYKGYIESLDQTVAVKQLDRKGMQGSREFFSEVLMLSLVQHPNLVNLVGYCADGDQRILVYEYMANGSLENHLLDLPPGRKPLDWDTRMKIAEGAAKGLEYLHDDADPPIIYRDFKAANILLDENFNPKLSDFGLAKLGPTEGKDHVSTRVMGTYGYCAPEYAMTGQLTTKSDVYSFGVVFLEVISGRRVIDNERPTEEQNLINWAEPLFKDRQKFNMMADPLLEGNYPVKALYQALAVAAMCLQEDSETRPGMADVVTAIDFLAKPKAKDNISADSPRSNSLHGSSRKGGSSRRDHDLHASSVKEGSSRRGHSLRGRSVKEGSSRRDHDLHVSSVKEGSSRKEHDL